MANKRIISSDSFNLIDGCYSNDFFEHGHIPVSLEGESYNIIGNSRDHVPVKKIDKSLSDVIQCKAGFVVYKFTRSVERSPKFRIIYKDQESWDKAIDAARMAWGNNIYVKKLTTTNTKTKDIIVWGRKLVENGGRISKLIVESINGQKWEDCDYRKQQSAAGDMWEDTCVYSIQEYSGWVPACHLGSHS